MEATITYLEALRYMDNAKTVLKKAGKDGKDYADKKYVRMASGTAYSAVLLAIDEYLRRKEGAKFKKPKSIDDYRIRLSKQDKSLLSLLNAAYDSLHISGYYFGTTSVKTISNGFGYAFGVIGYIKD